MKKAKIIFLSILVLAGIGGAMAARVIRFTTIRFLTYTTEYTTNGIVYTAGVSACIRPLTGQFVTTNPASPLSTGYSTTSTVIATGTTTFTSVNGTATITFAVYPCINPTTTRVTNIL